MNRLFSIKVYLLLLSIFLIASYSHAQSTEVINGLNWLTNNQRADGSWGLQNNFRDTATVIDTYRLLEESNQSYLNAISWLSSTSVESCDYIARRIISLVGTGADINSDLQNFVLYQNDDGGWGYAPGFGSDIYDTALVLYAFNSAQFHSPNAAAKAVNYLVSKQNTDGSWSMSIDSPGDVVTTSMAIVVLENYGSQDIVAEPLNRSIAWLKAKQNPDGGFGESPSTIHGTAFALMALLESGQIQAESLQNVLNYITSSQRLDGSWGENAYATAMALQVLAGLKPNLSIFVSDVTISKLTPKSGEIINISAVVRNTGAESASNIPVQIFAEDPEHQLIQIGTTQTIPVLPVGGSSAVEVDFDTKNRQGLYTIIVKIDPDNTMSELTKEDNEASVQISIMPISDLAISNENITFSKNPANIGEDITVTATVSNYGNYFAKNIEVAYYHDFESQENLIGTVYLPLIEAGQTAPSQIIWKPNRIGSDINIYVIVDPSNKIDELTKDNNQAVKPIEVIPVTDPNLTISRDIILNPSIVEQDGSVEISATVKNEGFAPVDSVEVAFYKGDPGVGEVLLNSAIVQTLTPGSSYPISFNWTNITEYGERLIYVKVNPSNTIKEFNEDDNAAFATLKILSYPDLIVSPNSIAFTPAAPKDGDIVSISVTVKNNGDQDASNFRVEAYEGSTIISSQSIPLLSAKSQQNVTFTYDTAGKTGLHEIKIVVDPDNAVQELSKDNNQALKTFSVFNADMWLTEKYFSPNGDGIKDSTQLFFRLDSPMTISVVVLNKKGEIVRAFSGPELENIDSGSVIWDGFDDTGKVVDDGQYRIQLRAIDGNVLQDALVVVDNNNSPLSEALTTGNLLMNDLSCMMPETAFGNYYLMFTNTHIWIPDGSGILYYVEDYENQANNGLYVMSPDGKNIQKISSDEWLMGSNRYVVSLALSPNSKKIALLTHKTDNDRPLISELWVMDIDGSNLNLLDMRDPNSVGDFYAEVLRSAIIPGDIYNNDFSGIEWSSDNETIAYPVIWWNGTFYNRTGEIGVDLTTVNIQTGVITSMLNKTIPASTYQNSSPINDYFNTHIWIGFKWSPNGNSIAVSVAEESTYYTFIGSLWIISKDGSEKRQLNIQDIIPCSFIGHCGILSYDAPSQWVDDSLLYLHGHGIIDINTEYFRKAFGNPVIFSPDKKKIMYFDGSNYAIYDISSNTSDAIDIYVTGYYRPNYDYNRYPIQFSPDGKKIAFVASKNGNEDLKAIAIVDLETKAKTVFSEEIWGPNYEILDGAAWSPDNNFLIANVVLRYPEADPETGLPYTFKHELYLIDINTGEKRFLAYGMGSDEYRLKVYNISAYKNYFVFYSEAIRDSSAGCISKKYLYEGYYTLWGMSSAANLITELILVKGDSQVVLTGTASDLNFEGYKIEYASFDEPATWYPIIPFSDMPVLNDTFATWIPPHEGGYYVRLTAWDKAGNVTEKRTRISWMNPSSSITNLYTSSQIFSPNGDGNKDTVELHYTVLEPVHLEFYIYDGKNNLLLSFSRDHSVPSEYSLTWDGRDENGNTVPDGDYRIEVFDYEFFVEVDNTLPSYVSGYISKCKCECIGDSIIPNQIFARAQDKNFKEWRIEISDSVSISREWKELYTGYDELIDYDCSGQPIAKQVGNGLDIDQLTGKEFRITAEDYAGNQRTGLFESPENIYIEGIITDNNIVRIDAAENIINKIDYVIIQWEYPPTFLGDGEWTNDLIVYNEGNNLSEYFSLNWDYLKINLIPIAFRLKIVDVNGKEFLSNRLGIAEGILFDPSVDRFLLLTKIIPPSLDDPDNYTFKGFHNLEDKEWTLEVQKSPDSDFQTFYSIPLPPQDQFEIKINKNNFDLCKSYRARFVAKTVESTIESNKKVLEIPCIEFIYGYPEADSCNSLSQKVKVVTSLKMVNLAGSNLKELRIGISENKEPFENIPSINEYKVMSPVWGNEYFTVFDVSSLPEGNYILFEVLKYSQTDVNTNREVSKEIVVYSIIIIDKTLPTATITYPDQSLKICPVMVSGENGELQGIPVQGIAVDNTGTKHYDLFYGSGETTEASVPTPIKGKGAIHGQLGIWEIPDSHNTTYSLKLKAVDDAGNVSCDTISFSVDRSTEILDLSTDKDLFSPNGDGVLDDVSIGFQIDEYATVDVKIFKLLETDGTYSLDSTPVRTLVSGFQHLGGVENIVWDGKDDSNTAALDGLYGIAVSAADSCSNTNMDWISIEVDNTPPTTIITYPMPPTFSGNIIEVQGTADDKNFQSYTLDVGQGNEPPEWITISSNTNPVQNNILGLWNSSGIEGIWTLRLSAVDIAGNRNISTVAYELGGRKNLINELNVIPKLFSPNNDVKLETTLVTYNLTDSCQITIEILDSSGIVKKTYTITTPSAGTYTFSWDGRDNVGTVVPDGVYTVRLTAVLLSNPSVTQEEMVTVIVDSTPPIININQPLNNSYIKGNIAVTGTIIDSNLIEYSISYTGDGTVILDKANQNRENYTFGVISGIPEGNYTLNVKATDLGENTTERDIAFVIDRTSPKVAINTPRDGEYYGYNKGIINISGIITEANLEIYNLRYGSGDNPSQWIGLQSGNTIPDTEQLFSWNVGNGSGIPDGLYSLSLSAQDKAGLTGETKVVRITVDNTMPEVAITSPQDGSYVREPIDIRGTAYDPNIDKYTLELSQGQCSSAFKWGVVRNSTISIRDGVLLSWQVLPSDGDYCLKLTTTDKLGNRAEIKINIKVDTHPPVPPTLSGNIENKSNAQLTWTQNTEPDLSGYNLYRDGQKINASLMTGINYLDENLTEGIHAYTVTALDLAGNESNPSNELKLRVDFTGPDAKILSPLSGTSVSGIVDIKGTAYSADDFKLYRVYIGQSQTPASWSLIRTSPVPLSNATLTQWDSLGLEGLYSVKLEAEDISGNINTHQIVITIDDIPPAPPVLISAIPDDSEVTLIWLANTEPDLIGYLLYRNNQLANVSGVVVGDLKPYLISGTTYLDKTLPDGKYRYCLIAMDHAGNLSGQSNAIELNIDTHPPHAIIVEPVNRAKFTNETMIKAESADIDIASVQFQYKNVNDEIWINLGNPITQMPYIIYIDPSTLGLTYGDYNLRAVAIDEAGKTDPSPSSITVTYTDLTEPDAPQNLKAQTNGMDVTLTWTPNAEADIDGYNIYRNWEGWKTKINTALLKEATYQDGNLSDGQYIYEATAVDVYGNESEPSNSATARIYAPIILQSYTPVDKVDIQIIGSNTSPVSTVEIFIDTDSGQISQGTTPSDAQGNFISSITLILGENRITAKATDSTGNISRSSEMVVVVYNEPPSPPTGLTTSVQDYNVTLTWNPNTESDLSGYNLYRNGDKLNTPLDITSGNVFASSSAYFNEPWMAFDLDPFSCWLSGYSYSTFNPVWWEIDLPSPELINHIEILWFNDLYSGLYAGKDYEIQVWSGYAWITQTKVTGNTEINNVFDFKPSYRTDKIRIYITDITNTDYNYYQQVGISEIRILNDNLISDPSYQDANLHDGNYTYKVAAVDYYGFESLPSEETTAAVGDVTPPEAPQNLTAITSGSNVILVWSANSEPDLAGYNVYRNTAQGWQKINTSLLTETTYTDINLMNGMYTYRVTAVDTVGNESLPSNEVTVNVFIALLQPPINLQVSTIPEGGALSISWEYLGGDAAGYNLYRSLTSGGSYTKVNSSYINNTVYLDTGLTNGVAYYYVVTAVDSVGNDSAYSNEAMGIPSDTAAPSRPGIFFPTLSGIPVVLYKDKTDISGIAEPAFTVELFKDGNSAGRTFALDNDMIQSFAIDANIWDMTMSPDGKTLAYQDNGSLWLKTLSTGNTVQIIQEGYSPIWSPDGSMIAYLFNDNSGNTRIGIYDIGTGQIIPLTDDTYVYEYSPSWSFDRGKIAFLSNRGGSDNVWVKDINTGSLTQATYSGYPSNPRLSPDGKKLAYFEYQNLFIADLLTGDTLMVDDNTDGYSLDWSNNSKRLLFISYANGNGDAFVYDLDNNEKTQITESDYGINYPMWSPDGNTIVYERYEPDWSISIWITSSNIQDQRRLLPQNLYNLNYLSWLRSGGIAYRDQQDVLDIIYLKGHFSFKDIQLDAGENVFYATSTDSSGNTSLPSEEISVTFDESLMPDLPDLAVTDDDIFIYPPYPIKGQEAMIIVFIKNKGLAEVKDVGTDIYLWDSQGNITLLKSENISSIAPQSEEYISFTLNTTSMTGANKIIAVADPLDKIYEVIETDNLAIKEFLIAEGEGITLTTSLDNSQYSSNQDVHINIILRNSGPERNGMLHTGIEDDSGNPVILLNEQAVSIPYADENQYNLVWNTGNTYAGPYMVHTIFKDGSDVITESTVPFTIIPDINIDSSVVTNKIAYGSNEDVSMTINIKNNGNNYVISGLDVKVKVMDAFNNALFNDNKTIINLLPGASDNINSTWNTGLVPAGNYTIVVEIYRNDELIMSKSALFVVNASSIITGSITVSPTVVLAGSNAQVGYVVQNTGNTAINGLSLNLFIIDPGTQTVMSTYGDIIDLGMNTTKSGGVTFSTQGYALKTYTASLQYVYQGSTKTLATASFTVKDGLPPVVTIVSPISGNSYNLTVDITVIAADDASGVDRIEYQIDSRGWGSLPIADPTTGMYSTSWMPSAEDVGLYTISVRAMDKAGNTSPVMSVTITVILSLPTGTISINNNDPYTNDVNVTLTLHATDSSGNVVAKMCISNTTSCTAWEDYTETKVWTLTPGDGTKTVYVWYQDNLGNTDTAPYSDSITLDMTTSLLIVSTLSDGSWTNNDILNISGEVTDNIGIQQLTINEEVVTINPDGSFSYPVVLEDGQNTITVMAVDLAGNEASDTRTINLDMNAPIITIAIPPDNMKTNQSSIDVTGTVYEESTVMVKVNDAAPVLAVMDGYNFSLTVTLIYGINTIEVTATDLAGNTSTVKRTMTFDDLNPSLSVTDPAQDVKTDHADMIIRGEVDDLTAIIVTITMDGNIYTPLLIGGQFEQPVTFTEEKTYQIYVNAVDEVGNETLVQRNVVYDITAPMVTLDPVTSPTNVNSQVLTGTMEIGATVSVTCLTATVGTVTYPTTTTWTADLSDMLEGDNAIAIIATDEAGNTSSPIFATIIFSAGNSVVNTGPATVWIGLKNSDDQGTQFDLRTELYINSVKISDGETLCITGVTRNPSYAKEVIVPFNPILNGTYTSGDILSLKLLTRIGTTPDGQKCSGPGGSHNNAVGLRLYYDSSDRPSRFSYETVQDPIQYLFLHSSGSNYFLDNVLPTGAVKYKDSSGVNYNNGNPWKEIGTWIMVLQ